MPIRAKLDTSGIKEALEDLAAKVKNINQGASLALAEGGDVLLYGMLERVPRDTGNLAEHLERTEPEQDGNYIFIEVGISRKADKRTAIYATAQEYGTSQMAAQPYVRPTIDNDMKYARKAMIEKLIELQKK